MIYIDYTIGNNIVNEMGIEMKIRILSMLMCSLAIIVRVSSRPVVVNGGEVTINGAITGTQIDIMVNYTANVKWLAVIFSKDEVNTDLHLLVVDESNAALPVRVWDCHLDENSQIVYDDVNNIQPSITSFTGNIDFGLKIAYNRDLNTNDLKDKRFYADDIIQICFMSSTVAFVGGGFEYGNEKICSFFSLHTEVDYFQDRLLGNWAATSLFGGGNLTVYATQSSDEGTFEPWLFLGVIHKQQGLTPFDGRWIGITYEDSLAETDLTVVEYGFRDSLTEVNVLDFHIQNSTYAADDYDYPLNQGGDDVTENLGGINPDKYLIALYKRKLSTGDNNRDKNVTTGNETTFCFILGDALLFSTFTYEERVCLTLKISTSYFSNFRVSEDAGDSVIEYVEPPNSVLVVNEEKRNVAWLLTVLIVLLWCFI